jgi:hypothetical protein
LGRPRADAGEARELRHEVVDDGAEHAAALCPPPRPRPER